MLFYHFSVYIEGAVYIFSHTYCGVLLHGLQSLCSELCSEIELLSSETSDT